jgi:hypothetical protein
MNLLVQPNTSARFIPAEIWEGLIHDEVLRQCDHLDGVRSIIDDRNRAVAQYADFDFLPIKQVEDGILNDPTACKYVISL